MARQVFQTEQTLEWESRISEFLEKQWNCVAHKSDPFQPIDLALYRNNNLVSWCEIKTSTYNYNAFSTYIIKESKYKEACKIFKEMGLPTFLVVKWKDQIGYCRLNEIKIMKTVDQPDHIDGRIFRIIHININEFVCFNKQKTGLF